ncbi:MAG: trypsin-like peptidase domain-containing protein [Pirellulaceae bacterium]
MLDLDTNLYLGFSMRKGRIVDSTALIPAKLLALTWALLPWIAWSSQPACAQPPAFDPGGLAAVAAIEQATISAIGQAEHSVVAIAIVHREREAQGGFGLPQDAVGFDGAFSSTDSPDSPDFIPSLFGSGVVISNDGYIVTCAHVLDDPRKHDYIVWLDKQSYPARVVGRPAKVLASDPFSDLAVLKIDAIDLTPIAFAEPGGLRKGQFVIALGNPHAIARDGQPSASWGIISNLKRFAPADSNAPAATKETIHQLGTMIQTDAKLNLGTSGGALINMRGEMIGLTTSLAATSGYEQSAGFAIAVDELFTRAVETLKLGKLPEYGFLGIQPDDLRPFEQERGMSGAKVSVVIPGLPGDQAGLRSEDIITAVDEQPIENRNDLFRELSQAAAGSIVDLRVERYQPGRRIPEQLTLQAELSKKFVSSARPGYAINAALKWRGLEVEYTTALSPELVRSNFLSGRRSAPKLAALSVTPDTPAWHAGLRPGYGIHAVNGRAVNSPDEFHQAINGVDDAVTLTVTQPDGRQHSLSVAAAN